MQEDNAMYSGKATFPCKLHQLLQDAESKGFQAIVSWQPNRQAFIVRKPSMFVEQILPKYFGRIKWKSFTRQLNLYDFTRITEGPMKNSYYHEHFLRDKPSECSKIVRKLTRSPSSTATPPPQQQENALPNQVGHAYLADNLNQLFQQENNHHIGVINDDDHDDDDMIEGMITTNPIHIPTAASLTGLFDSSTNDDEDDDDDVHATKPAHKPTSSAAFDGCPLNHDSQLTDASGRNDHGANRRTNANANVEIDSNRFLERIDKSSAPQPSSSYDDEDEEEASLDDDIFD